MTRDGNYRSKKPAPPLSRQTSNFRDSSFKFLQRFSAFRINAGEKERKKKILLIRTICPRNEMEVKKLESKSIIPFSNEGWIRKVLLKKNIETISIAFEILTGVLKGECNLHERRSIVINSSLCLMTLLVWIATCLKQDSAGDD